MFGMILEKLAKFRCLILIVFTFWDIERYLIVIVCVPVCGINQSNLFYRAVFVHNQKSEDKNVNILRTKKALNIKKKHYPSFLMDFFY